MHADADPHLHSHVHACTFSRTLVFTHTHTHIYTVTQSCTSLNKAAQSNLNPSGAVAIRSGRGVSINNYTIHHQSGAEARSCHVNTHTHAHTGGSVKHRLAAVSEHTGRDFQMRSDSTLSAPFCRFNAPKVYEFISGTSVTAKRPSSSSGDEDVSMG